MAKVDPVAQTDEIRRLELSQNEGRGVSCVRSATFSMDRGDLEGARLVANWDHDTPPNAPSAGTATPSSRTRSQTVALKHALALILLRKDTMNTQAAPATR